MAPTDPLSPTPDHASYRHSAPAPARSRTPSIIVAAGAALGLTLGGLGVAAAQDDGTTETTVTEEQGTDTSTDTDADEGSDDGWGESLPRGEETPLTGTLADQVTAAAQEAVPGGTVLRVETDADGAAYEAHVQTAEGADVVVTFDEDLGVIEVLEHQGHPGHQGHHGRSGHPCPDGESLDDSADDSGDDSADDSGDDSGDAGSAESDSGTADTEGTSLSH